MARVGGKLLSCLGCLQQVAEGGSHCLRWDGNQAGDTGVALPRDAVKIARKKGCVTLSLIPVMNLLQSDIYAEHPCFFCSKRSVQAKRFSFQTDLSPFPSHS